MYRINYKDVVKFALVYSYRVFRTTILKESEVKLYEQEFYKNLKKSSIEWQTDYLNNEEPIYIYVQDKDENGYFIIKPDVITNNYKMLNLGLYPLKIVLESQRSNTLSVLNIELKDGLLKKKDEESAKTYRK